MTWFKRATVVAATVGVVTLAVAAPASAHVTVSSSNAVQGGYSVATFRVPNESDTASTTKVEVTLPIQTAPVASVSIQPVPGWTAVTEKAKLPTPIKTDDGELTESVSKITWTAAKGSEIKPGQFQQFQVSMGPLPKVDQMVFKALQTYSDGKVVRWIDEPAAAGAEEPESPAPTLKLAAAAAGADDHGAAAAPVAAPAEESSNSGTAFGIAGLALGVIALIIALLAYRRAGAGPAEVVTAGSNEKVSADK